MVQIDPGPTPTLIASAPAATRFLAPVPVATFPATTSIFGKSFFSNLTASTTPLESPCALSSTKTSTPASTSNLAKLLVDAGVDVFVLDSAHGDSKGVVEAVKLLKKDFPKIDVVAGNVATGTGARNLVAAGADAIKVGVGPGSICTTRIIAGVGVPQLSAVMEVVKEAKDIPVISDGGVRYSGDVVKAIGAGASTVMLGSIFAGTEEASSVPAKILPSITVLAPAPIAFTTSPE